MLIYQLNCIWKPEISVLLFHLAKYKAIIRNMIEIKPAKPCGKIEIPASKSQTIRAFLLACFAKGKSIIRHSLLSSDTISCIDAVKALGAKVEFSKDGSICYVDSTVLNLREEGITIDAGNSGTTEYLLLGLAASLGIPVTITGDKQLLSRPVGPLSAALSDLGATINESDGLPPVTIKGPLKGGCTEIECRTSQYLSSLLLAAPLAEGDTQIDCSLLYEKPYVRMTLEWLDKEGIVYEISDDLEHAKIKGNQKYRPFDEYIAGDFSSASFFFAALYNFSAISGCPAKSAAVPTAKRSSRIGSSVSFICATTAI